MKLLIEVRHPAHVHHFKHFYWEMVRRGHECRIMAVQKEIVTRLLDLYAIPYVAIGQNRVGMGAKLREQLRQNVAAIRVCRDFRPDLVIGRPSQSVTLTGTLTRTPTLVFAEDDLRIVLLAGLAAYPFVRTVLTPNETDLGIFTHKKIGYSSYQKLAYLHPRHFQPDRTVVESLGARYSLLRLARLTAHHDSGIGGIDDVLLRRLVERLEQRGAVHISSERELPPEFDRYRLRTSPIDIHHVMAFADVFVSDSQSMSMEAAMLGTPSLRFSDFAGRINVLEELEHNYGLTFGIPTDRADALFSKLDELFAHPDLRTEWTRRQQRMLADKIALSDFMVWFVEQFPDSIRVMKQTPDFQFRFR